MNNIFEYLALKRQQPANYKARNLMYNIVTSSMGRTPKPMMELRGGAAEREHDEEYYYGIIDQLKSTDDRGELAELESVIEHNLDDMEHLHDAVLSALNEAKLRLDMVDVDEI